MAIHWQIKFRSLRANTQYTVNIYDSTYSGNNPIQLKGGAEPFVTNEDEDGDEFKPTRTQSGSIRIVDDGLDANGNPWNWRTLLPMTDTDRPVTLTDSTGTVYWQGFMQAQNFGGTLYGNPQEREFPVQCCLSILRTIKVSTTESSLHNFAYLAYKVLVTNMPTLTFTDFIFQGGADARQWLLKKFNWNNFLTETEEGVYQAKYTHYDILEDMCRFMGWTARTRRKVVYFTCMDDTSEQTTLTLTSNQLLALANETDSLAGVTNAVGTVALSGDIFASVNNDDFQDRGPYKVTVNADVNKNEQVVKVFPVSVEKQLDSGGWTWAHGQSDPEGTGYFETAMIYNFDASKLKGYNYGTRGAFSMRQIYSDVEDESAANADMILINNADVGANCISLETKEEMAYAGGSLTLSGAVYVGSQPLNLDDSPRLLMRLGIGRTRSSARWWYLDEAIYTTTVSSGWSTPGVTKTFWVGIQGSTIVSTSCLISGGMRNFKSIPVADEANLYGYLYIDFLGLTNSSGQVQQTFQIANFAVTFSRDSLIMPTSINEPRAREVKKERVSSQEYTSNNNNSTGIEWSADCIFASDNNMDYGYGLLMEPNGRFLSTFQYNGNNAHPEQHLANRVTSFWSSSKRHLTANLRTNAITEPRPSQKVTMDGTTFSPIAISHNWRDDITTLTLLQI